MALPQAFQSLVNGSDLQYSGFWYEFDQIHQLQNWDWFGSGHNPPDTLDSIDGGQITLGSGSAGSGDWLMGQHSGSCIRLNRLNKTFLFGWTATLSSATLTGAFMGLAIAQAGTNVLDGNVTDFFGFYANSPSGPAAGNWICATGFDSITQYTTYSQTTGLATDTNKHVFAIRLVTDSAVLGAGTMDFFVDGVPQSRYSSGSAAIFPHD